MSSLHRVQVRRIDDPPRDDDGRRVLVDRVWPRGLSKQRARLDEWCNQIAPSTVLRGWYDHDPDRYPEFARRYRSELTTPQRADALAHLRDLATHGPLCLLTAATRTDLSEAAVLADLLRPSNLTTSITGHGLRPRSALSN